MAGGAARAAGLAGPGPRRRIEHKGRAVGVHTRTLRRSRRRRSPGWPSRSGSWPALRADRRARQERLGDPGRRDRQGRRAADIVAEIGARQVIFAGDDLGDLPAFGAALALREEGMSRAAGVLGLARGGCAGWRSPTRGLDGPPGMHALADRSGRRVARLIRSAARGLGGVVSGLLGCRSAGRSPPRSSRPAAPGPRSRRRSPPAADAPARPPVPGRRHRSYSEAIGAVRVG